MKCCNCNHKVLKSKGQSTFYFGSHSTTFICEKCRNAYDVYYGTITGISENKSKLEIEMSYDKQLSVIEIPTKLSSLLIEDSYIIVYKNRKTQEVEYIYNQTVHRSYQHGEFSPTQTQLFLFLLSMIVLIYIGINHILKLRGIELGYLNILLGTILFYLGNKYLSKIITNLFSGDIFLTKADFDLLIKENFEKVYSDDIIEFELETFSTLLKKWSSQEDVGDIKNLVLRYVKSLNEYKVEESESKRNKLAQDLKEQYIKINTFLLGTNNAK